MRIKALSRKEINKGLPFIWDVFLEYETVNYSEKRKQAFWDAIHSEEYLAQLKAYGAFENKEIVGIIATRNEGSHVALFFVKGMYQGKGIGRMLWNAVLEENIINTVTVHSSLFAVPIYEKLGFISTDNIQEDGGIQHTPMEYKMFVRKDCPCSKKGCIRHGHCNECRAYHATSKRPRPCDND